jgi:cation:H+ antiporter
MIYVFVFFTSGVVVVIVGIALARYADTIATATKIGRLWIGSVLLAGATSLPELTTDIAAVRYGATDLAVGDLFGSSMANMLILAIIDLVPPRRRVLQQVAFDHALAASLAISLNALAAVLVLIGDDTSFAWVGPGSLVLFLAYFAGTRAVYRHAVRKGESTAEEPEPMSLRRAVVGFALASLIVLAAAPAFAWSAKGIAEITGLGNTFVGTWLVGLATSLPELAVCFAAVKMGSFDLAVGNLFGSNAFNMAIFLPLDLVQSGNVFAVLDPNHALSGIFAVILMSLGLAAIVYRAERRFAMAEPSSALMLAAYLLALWLLYLHTAGVTPMHGEILQ